MLETVMANNPALFSRNDRLRGIDIERYNSYKIDIKK